MKEKVRENDRRRAARRVLATQEIRAIVRSRDAIAEYAVANLGPGGALVVGPPLPRNALVEVVLRGPDFAPVKVLGRVAHAGPTEAGIGFLLRGDDAEDRIQSLLLHVLERQRGAKGAAAASTGK